MLALLLGDFEIHCGIFQFDAGFAIIDFDFRGRSHCGWLLSDVDIHAETFTLHSRRFTKNIYKMRGKKQ